MPHFSSVLPGRLFYILQPEESTIFSLKEFHNTAMEKKAKITFWVQKPQLSHAGALLCQGRVPSMLPAVLRWQQNPYRDRIFPRPFYFGVFSLNFSVFLMRFKQNLGQHVLPDVTKSPTALPRCPLDGKASSQVGELRELLLHSRWARPCWRGIAGN